MDMKGVGTYMYVSEVWRDICKGKELETSVRVCWDICASVADVSRSSIGFLPVILFPVFDDSPFFFSIYLTSARIYLLSLCFLYASLYVIYLISLHLFLKKMGQPRPLFRLFSIFSNKHYNFYNKYMWKNVHPVYGAGIRTHNIWNMSLFS